MWPSEEALAVFLLSRRDTFKGAAVLELGAGDDSLCDCDGVSIFDSFVAAAAVM
jgi:predicted nicotinamide N-methyase